LESEAAMKDVLIDATPLRAGSGYRGIGRMIFDLLHGLEAIRSEWQRELRIRVVHDFSWRTGPLVTEDLSDAADRLFAARGSAGDSLVYRRRVLLDRGARALGAELLHLPEAIGTPLTHSVKRVVTCHDLIPLRMPREYLRGVNRVLRPSIDARRYRNAERIVAISERTRDDLSELLHIDPARVDVVPNGIDVSQWSPDDGPVDRDRLRALNVGERPYVLYVGYWDARKDVPTMLRALAEARRTCDIDLVWAGHFKEIDLVKMRRYLAREGVLSELAAVRFTGFVSADDLAILYRHATAHAFLSRLEGFGLSVVEAMASGCPVILARGSGADEVGGDVALAVAPGDAASAARAIVELTSDERKRVALRDAGVVRARHYDRTSMARGYIAAYKRALAAG
jgi:glycosyltransferase involved in cell wall biosynthesis